MKSALPLVLLLLFLACAFVWLTWRTRRLTGKNPYVLPDGDDVAGYVGKGFRVAVAGSVVAMTLAAFPQGAVWLGPIGVTGEPWLYYAGFILSLAALTWTVIAQYQMGRSWRIGIDATDPPALVEGGLFAFSRNPIFLGMRVALVGILLMVPGAVVLAIVVAAEIFMQVQVRLEEAYLARVHAQAYARYQARTTRWLGRRILENR